MLESATEMKSVLTANSKPNCLIIDEIDGAPSVSMIHVHVDHSVSNTYPCICILYIYYC